MMKKCSLTGWLVLFFMVAGLSQGHAETGKVVPFVSIKQEYTDNISFSSSNEQEDYITTCTGGITLSHKSERVKAELTGQVFRLSYWDHNNLDATDGAVNASINDQVTERFGVGASADYRKDSRRDTDADTTGLILNGDREQANFGLSSSMVFTELMRGQISGGYGMNDIEQINNEENNDSYSVNLGLVRNLSKTFDNTTGLFNISYLHYTSDIQAYTPGTLFNTRSYLDYESDVIQVYTGFSRQLTELTSFYLQGGASYTDTKENRRVVYIGGPNTDVTDPEQSDDTFGGVLLTGINYDGLYWDLGVSLSHDVRGGTNSNGTVERSSVSLNLDRKVSDQFYLTLGSSCFLNKNERALQADLDELTVNVQPGFRYMFSDTLFLSGVYRYTMVEDRQTDTSSERNLAYLLLRKNFDF